MLSCLFSGLDPDTDEHVIPDWLQARFGLQRARYQLPSASGLDYRHARVAATRACNEAFGKIETRISQGRFVWEEVYLWLFKIHIGLMYRDVSLRSDIRDPNSGTVIPYRVIDHQVTIFRELFKHYSENGELGTDRSPPGSVFILPSMGRGHFDFQHSFTCGCVGVNIGEFYLAASLWDFGCAKDFGYFDWVWNEANYRCPPENLGPEKRAAWYLHAQATWLCNLGYWSFRWNINMYRISETFQPKMPEFEGPAHQRREDPEELARICRTFGLELKEFIPSGKSIFAAAVGRAAAK
ncbi:MAG: hypothetical protein ACLQME_21630 [Alphaproteobacteria bacterium]